MEEAIPKKKSEYMYIDEVVERTLMSESTIRRKRKRRMQEENPFPEPVEHSPQLKVYVRAEIDAWCERQKAIRDRMLMARQSA